MRKPRQEFDGRTGERDGTNGYIFEWLCLRVGSSQEGFSELCSFSLLLFCCLFGEVVSVLRIFFAFFSLRSKIAICGED